MANNKETKSFGDIEQILYAIRGNASRNEALTLSGADLYLLADYILSSLENGCAGEIASLEQRIFPLG